MASQPLQPDEAYFSIRQDMRRCASPHCGGFFVAQLNASETRCADDVMRAECYVAVLVSDYQRVAEQARLQSGTAIVTGRILPRIFDGAGNLGEINVSQLWEQFFP